MSIVVEIKFNRFPTLGADMRRVVSEVVRKTAFDVEAGTKQRAPVDTGLLRNSYNMQMESELTVVVGTDVEYAVFQEFGTHKMAAQPHLTPAAEAERQPFIAALTQIERMLK